MKPASALGRRIPAALIATPTGPVSTAPSGRSISKWLALAVLATFSLQPATIVAQTTAFSYQGRLNDNGSPASGVYDLRFAVYDSANSPGILIAGPVTNSATGVTNGLFTVTLDFGDGVFTGPARWLELDVRTNGGGPFTTLLPRQPLLSCPTPSWPTPPATCWVRCPPRS